MLIAHISDTHIIDEGEVAYGRVKTNAALETAIRRINALSPRPDLVLATGDLTDHGRPEQYDALLKRLSDLSVPVFVGTGNHDDRETFRSKMRSVHPYLPETGHLNYVIEGHTVRIIMLDSTGDDHHEGEFCEARAKWLDETLAAKPDQPTLIGMHHPPFKTGIKWMDGDGADWAKHFVDVVSQHDQIVRIICGHIHRPISASVGGRLVQTVPSTAHQVAAQLDPDFDISVSQPEFEMEPPGFQLLVWNGDDLVSHILHTEAYERFEPIPREVLDRIIEDRKAGQRASKETLEW